ncbi:hypothetical protein COB72_00520, partial [bacterium]
MEIEVEDDLAGTKHECLGCGDINRVPAGDTATVDAGTPEDSKKVDRAEKAGFPPDFGPEVRVQIVRRCWFLSRAIKFTLVVLIILIGLIGSIWVPIS